MMELDDVNDEDIIDAKVMELSTLLVQHSDYSAQRSSLIYFLWGFGF
jgi:two-component SAPR family response regulator